MNPLVQIEIRPAVKEDGEAVARMATELSAHEDQPPPEFDAEKFCRDGFGPNAAFFTLIAEREGRPVGYLISTVSYDIQFGQKIRNIVDLYVDPESRRMDVGRALVSEIARRAWEAGENNLIVTTFAENAEANAFYRAIGARLDKSNVYYWSARQMNELIAGKLVQGQ